MHKKKIYLKINMSAKGSSNLEELKEIVQSITEIPNHRVILQLCCGRLDATNVFNSEKEQDSISIEFPSTTPQEENHGLSLLTQGGSIIFHTLKPIVEKITEIEIFSSKLRESDELRLAHLRSDLPELEHLTLAMPSEYCNKVLFGGLDLASKVSNLHIDVIEPGADNAYLEDNSTEYWDRIFRSFNQDQEKSEELLPSLLKQIEYEQDNLKLKSISLSHYGLESQAEYSIQDIIFISGLLKRTKVKLSIKDAKLLVKLFAQEEIANLKDFIKTNNELIQFLECLVDSDVLIDLGANQDIWKSYLEKEYFLKIIKEASEAGGNNVSLTGIQLQESTFVTRVRALVEEAENGNNELEQEPNLDVILDIAVVRNYQNVYYQALIQKYALELTGGANGVYFHNKYVPKEVLYNIISFLPIETMDAERRNSRADTFTKEQMDAIAAKIIKDPLHYLEALDITKIIGNELINAAINEAIPSYDESHGENELFVLPLFMSDMVEDRWLLYFQVGCKGENNAKGFFIDPLTDYKVPTTPIINLIMCTKLFAQDELPVEDFGIFAGLQNIVDNSGAWIMYLIEEIQNKLSDIDDLSSISIDSSWVLGVINEDLQPDTYPDIEEITNRYEGYAEELMDMGDGGAYYQEMGIANNNSTDSAEEIDELSEELHTQLHPFEPGSSF